MASVPTIDLGLLPHESEPDVADPGSLRSWWRRAGTRRPALAALVAVLVSLLGAAAVPAQPRLVRLWTVPATDQLVLAGTNLYVTVAPGNGVWVRAYRVADGTLRWEEPVDSSGGWARLTLAGEVPLVSAPGPGGEEFVTAHDPDTGQARWRHRGWPYAVLADDRVVLTRPLPDAWPVDDGSRPGDGRHSYEVALVDLHSGELAWSQRFRVGEALLSTPAEASGELAHLLTLTPYGRLTRYDPDSGAVLASVNTPSTDDVWAGSGLVATSESGVVPVPYAQVGPDEVVLPEPSGLAGYDAVTLALRWRLSRPGRTWMVPCAGLVCAFTESGPAGRLEAIEPGTGQVRWSHTCGEELPGRQACVLFPRPPAPEGQLLVEELSFADDRTRAATWVLEVATGELGTQLSYWQLLGPADPDHWLLTRPVEPYSSYEDLRPVWLARWAGGSGPPEVLGAIDAGWCHPPAGDHLVCMPAEAGNAQVWRVR